MACQCKISNPTGFLQIPKQGNDEFMRLTAASRYICFCFLVYCLK